MTFCLGITVEDGLVGIAVGDNPRIIESRLKGYLV